MDIERFKDRFGVVVTQNGSPITVIKMSTDSMGFKHFSSNPDYTGTDMFRIILDDPVDWDDSFSIDAKRYRIFSINSIWNGGVIAYSEVTLFEDDFTHEMTVQSQARGLSGVNLAILDGNTKTFNARIASISDTGRLQVALHNDKPMSHVVTATYSTTVASIQVEDMLKSGSRSYEVLGIEDVNDAHRLVKLSVIEVLSA
jgi:hypothetical protein